MNLNHLFLFQILILALLDTFTSTTRAAALKRPATSSTTSGSLNDTDITDIESIRSHKLYRRGDSQLTHSVIQPSKRNHVQKGGSITLHMNIEQDMFDELANATTSIVIRRLTSYILTDFYVDGKVPLINKKINFLFSSIRVNELKVQATYLLLDKGFGKIIVNGIVAKTSSDVFTDGKSQGRFTAEFRGDAGGKFTVSNNEGIVQPSIHDAFAYFERFKLRTPRHFLNFVIQGIRLFFKKRIINILNQVTAKLIETEIPRLIQPLFNNISIVNGLVGDMLYSFEIKLVGDPVLTPQGADVTFKLKAQLFTD